MEYSKAKAIFKEDELDVAEAYLEDIKLIHPKMKIFKLVSNAETGTAKKTKNKGGYAIAGRFAMGYKTRLQAGITNWIQ